MARKRAWFLVRAADVSMVKEALRNLDPDWSRSDLAIVRVDEVEGGDYNLVVPVDAEAATGFEEVAKILDDPELKAHYQTLEVVRHERADNDQPPHLAAGYISQSELSRDNEHRRSEFYGNEYFAVVVTHGRQRGSPGFTPWG